MQELETESSWQEYVALMTERPELFREEGWLTIEKDPEVIRRYEQKSGKRIGVVYKSEYHMMVVDLIKGENGTHFCYERLLPMAVSYTHLDVYKRQSSVCSDGRVCGRYC